MEQIQSIDTLKTPKAGQAFAFDLLMIEVSKIQINDGSGEFEPASINNIIQDYQEDDFLKTQDGKKYLISRIGLNTESRKCQIKTDDGKKQVFIVNEYFHIPSSVWKNFDYAEDEILAICREDVQVAFNVECKLEDIKKIKRTKAKTKKKDYFLTGNFFFQIFILVIF